MVSFDRKNSKYFIRHKDSYEIRPLCIFLPKMSTYRRDFHKTKCVSFLIKDNKLSEKYDESFSSKNILTVNLCSKKI